MERRGFYIEYFFEISHLIIVSIYDLSEAVASFLIKRVRGTGSADPQRMLIFWVLLIFRIINVGLKFLVTRKRLTYHVAITDGIACRPLNYGVWNACET